MNERYELWIYDMFFKKHHELRLATRGFSGGIVLEGAWLQRRATPLSSSRET